MQRSSMRSEFPARLSIRFISLQFLTLPDRAPAASECTDDVLVHPYRNTCLTLSSSALSIHQASSFRAPKHIKIYSASPKSETPSAGCGQALQGPMPELFLTTSAILPNTCFINKQELLYHRRYRDEAHNAVKNKQRVGERGMGTIVLC